MNTIGENIAMFRKQKGFTQEALASAIGVSAQSISKWENNTNMPDIMLLPIIADVFGIRIDVLFGRQEPQTLCSPKDAYDMCCDAVLKTLISCMQNGNFTYPDGALEIVKKNLDTNNRHRTGIIRKEGIVYYRKEIGGLLLNKPENHWYGLLTNQETVDTIELLSHQGFRTALAEIIKTQKIVFTIPSLCNSCKIEYTPVLEEMFNKSNLFTVKEVDVDGKTISIYELVNGNKLFPLFAALTYAAEFSSYENVYSGYCGDGSYYFA